MDNVKNTQKSFPNINVDVSLSKCISVTLDPTVTFLQSSQFLASQNPAYNLRSSAYKYALDLSNLLNISHHISQIYSDQLEISIGTMDLSTSPWNKLLDYYQITQSRIIRCINKNTGSNIVKKNVISNKIKSNTIYNGTPPPLTLRLADPDYINRK